MKSQLSSPPSENARALAAGAIAAKHCGDLDGAAQLLARQGVLIVSVHAIDRPAHRLQPVVTLAFVDLYEGDTDRQRRQLSNPDDWQLIVMPSLTEKIHDLEAFGIRRVHVTGAMRLPMWFATGAGLPDVRGWVVSSDQRNVEWSSDASPTTADAWQLHRVELRLGDDLAVGIALTHNLAENVEEHVRNSQSTVRELLVLGPADGPGQTAVPDASFAVGWAHAARTRIIAAIRQLRPPQVHLFFAAGL